jgi:hypothetical protein
MGQRHAPAAFTPGKDSVPIVQEAAWAPGPFWTGAENVALTRIRSPDRPVPSQSLYRLSYPARVLCRKEIRQQMCEIIKSSIHRLFIIICLS